MLFFGHLGITTGIVKTCQELIIPRVFGDISHVETDAGVRPHSIFRLVSWFRGAVRSIDYRMVLLGSLLPDIIDKPMWIFTGSNVLWDGRGYAHSFIFSFVLLIAGIVFAATRNSTWLLTVSVGAFFHLALDQMWLNPVALWWPLLGPIHREATAGWLASLWRGLTSDPTDYVSEIIGFAVILYLSLRLLIGRRVMRFLKTGNINLTSRSPTEMNRPER
jgi:inner membrane protein